jgi:hypothetical protein
MIILDDQIFEIKCYIEGTVKSMLGWYNLKNDNEKDIICIITYYILNKFINENVKYDKLYYSYFYKNTLFTIDIIIKNNKYDLIFNEKIDNSNNNICTFNIITDKDYIIFEKIDYKMYRNIISKFTKD